MKAAGRYIIIILSLICICTLTEAAQFGRRFRFGAEWGIHYNPISLEQSNFIASEGYLVESNELVSGFHINGMINGFVGYDFSSCVNVAVHSGYLGLQKGERVIPISVRGTYCLSEKQTLTGSNIFIEGGVGFRKEHPLSWISKIGYSYRVNLGPISVDVNAAALFSYSHPEVYDKYGGHIVARKNLGYSRAYNLGILLTTAIVF